MFVRKLVPAGQFRQYPFPKVILHHPGKQGAELPCLIVNVMRGGPGLGTIQPSQADYFQTVKGGGHGDYKLIALAPANRNIIQLRQVIIYIST